MDDGFGYGAESLLVAMVDEDEFPLGELGVAPRLIGPSEPGEEAVFEVTLEGLPTDGELHRLTFVRIGGYGATAMDALGNALPFPAYPLHVTTFQFAEE